MNTVRLIICFVASITLVGCASMNEQECQTANWYNIGLEDGSAGQPMTSISSYRQACAKHGVTANTQQYNDGYNEGVINFCTPQKGYNLGRNGSQYNGVCPAPLEKPFVNAYQQGNDIYQQEQRVRSIESMISAKEQQIGDLTIAISDSEQGLLQPDLSAEARKAQLDLLLNQQQQRAQAQADLKAAIPQLVDAELDLARLLANAPY